MQIKRKAVKEAAAQRMDAILVSRARSERTGLILWITLRKSGLRSSTFSREPQPQSWRLWWHTST